MPEKAQQNRHQRIDGTHAILGIDIVSFSSMHPDRQREAISIFIGWVRSALSSLSIRPDDFRWSPSGDGGFITFKSVSACKVALHVAFEILGKTKYADFETNVGPVELKFSLHHGTVFEDDELVKGTNIWGEGINTAARILGVCAPNQILVSVAYYEAYIQPQMTDQEGNWNARKSVKSFYFDEVFQRTVKHEQKITVRNVSRGNLGLSERHAKAHRWRVIGKTWSKASEEFKGLVDDSVGSRSKDILAAIAAAKFLSNLQTKSAAVERLINLICMDSGSSETYHWLFSSLSQEEFKRALRLFQPRLVSKHEDFLCKEGQRSHSCFFIVSGELEISGPNFQVPIIVGPGAIVGEFALWIPGLKRTGNVAVVEDGLILEADIDEFRRLIGQSKKTERRIYDFVKNRLKDNVINSVLYFPGIEARERDALRSELVCEKHKIGSVLDVGNHSFVLIHGSVIMKSVNGTKALNAGGLMRSETTVGVFVLNKQEVYRSCEVTRECVAVRIPHSTLHEYQIKHESVRKAWARILAEKEIEELMSSL